MLKAQVLTYVKSPKGQSTMDKALALHSGSWGSNPDATKGFCTPFLSDTRAHALSHSQWLGVTLETSKIPSSTICQSNTDVRAMDGRRGFK